MCLMNTSAGDSEKLNYAIYGSAKLTSQSWPVNQPCVSQTKETQISYI